MKRQLAFAGFALLMACGGQTLVVGSNGDDGGHDEDATRDGGDGGRDQGGGGGGGAGGSTTMGGRPVDAGYYYGDGSFWVEGGAYKDLGAPDASADGGTDAAVDASPGCVSLAQCCPTLAPSSQSLCESVVSTGNAANCATELSMLQSAGSCTGVSVLASNVEVPPNLLVSDGTLLFWTTVGTPGLLAMPVHGGPITILLDGEIGEANNGSCPGACEPFLAVDDVNVYVLKDNSLARIPKSGAAATLVNESGAHVDAVTTLGGEAYWFERRNRKSSIKSAPLQGVAVTTRVEFPQEHDPYPPIAVTSSTVFMIVGGFGFVDFPLSGLPASGPKELPAGDSCLFVTSDTSAIYCGNGNMGGASNLRIASDGTVTKLGAEVSSSYIVFDDTYVYWADETSVGTIKKAPKAGGASATILARDANPVAIAIDNRAVYWADMGGYIKSVPK